MNISCPPSLEYELQRRHPWLRVLYGQYQQWLRYLWTEHRLQEIRRSEGCATSVAVLFTAEACCVSEGYVWKALRMAGMMRMRERRRKGSRFDRDA